MRKKMDAGAIYDSFPEGQTMSREDFVKEVARVNNPHSMMNDLHKLMGERGRQRTLGLYNKEKIDRATSR